MSFSTWRSLVDGSEVSAIPDSALNRYNAPDLSESDGETVDPWADTISSSDLPADGTPTLSVEAVNGVDAVNLDGDGYDYPDTLDAPATVILAYSSNNFSGLGTVLTNSDISFYNRQDNNEYHLYTTQSDGTGGSSIIGDQIVTLAVDDSSADVRVNGSEIISNVGVATGGAVLSSGSLFYRKSQNDRYQPADAVEIATYNERLSTSDIESEEQRLEDESNMAVLS